MHEKIGAYQRNHTECQTTKDIQTDYAAFFDGCDNVLDIPCGHGEFLEILKKQGTNGKGVDLDPELCREDEKKGLDVVCGDAFDYLDGVSPGTLDGVFSSHFMEHITYDQICAFIEKCAVALAKDGRIVIVTPNVHSLSLHLDWFHRDTDHRGWVHPEFLESILTQSGFKVKESKGNPKTAEPWFSDIKQKLVEITDIYRTDSQSDAGSSEVLPKRIGKVRSTLTRLIIGRQLKDLQEQVDELKKMQKASTLTIGDNVAEFIRRLDEPSEWFVYAERK